MEMHSLMTYIHSSASPADQHQTPMKETNEENKEEEEKQNLPFDLADNLKAPSIGEYTTNEPESSPAPPSGE